jgi:hypothetical protein
MDRRIFLYTLGGSAAALAAANLEGHPAQNPTALSNKRWSNLKYAVYFLSSDIEKLLVDPAERRKTLNYFAPIRPNRFYLEGPSQKDVDVPLLKKVAEAVRAEGIIAAGSMVPTVAGGPACYNNPEHMAILEKRARSMAQVFDELILDDWLFTICTCEKCVAERGQSTWADYRTRLLREKSKQHIIDPAKQVNPKIKVIIKYPDWAEGHRENGYDVDGETRQFDGMAVGIETRIPTTQDQHIPIYSGYVFQKWWPSVEPNKWVGSWLDNYEMQGHANEFVAQVWQAVLAQTPEIILWCAGTLYPTDPSSEVYPHFCEMLPEFDRVAGLLNGPARGVPMYLPYGSVGEYNVYGYLGMAGIPIAPVAQFPADSHNAIFSKHSLRDTGLADKLLARLRNGHDVFMTWGLFRELQGTEFKNMLSLVDTGGNLSSSMFRLSGWNWDTERVASERQFTFPRIETTTWPYVRDVAVIREDYDFGVMLKAKYLNANLYVLNLPENSYDLLRLPAAVLNKIRGECNNELGVQLKGPGGVSLYPFGSGQFVLYNMNEEPAKVALSFDKAMPSTGWKELLHGESLSVTEIKPPKDTEHHVQSVRSEVSLTLKPYELAVVQTP